VTAENWQRSCVCWEQDVLEAHVKQILF